MTGSSAAGYTFLIDQFSKLPADFGQNYQHLSQFLSQASTQDSTYLPKDGLESFLTSYDIVAPLHNSWQCAPTAPHSRPDLGQERGYISSSRVFKNYEDFAQYEVPPSTSVSGQIVFLRGYPSPAWIVLIATKYGLDPEIFRRFIDFRSNGDRTINYSTPMLPSAAANIIEVPVLTVGFREIINTHLNQVDVNSIRHAATDRMKQYRHRLHLGLGIPFGSSVVRDYHLLDETHFAIEQRITICVSEAAHSAKLNRGWVAVIWTDGGLDLFNKSEPGPWCEPLELLSSRGTSLYPIIRHKPGIALLPHKIFPALFRDTTSTHLPTLRPSTDYDTKQSVCLLHHNYGQTLRPDIMAVDVMYALNEVFELAASSQNQFLNLLDAKLIDCIAKINRQEFEVLSSLMYIKEILHSQMKHINATLASIQSSRHRNWPSAEGDSEQRAKITKDAVVKDYLHLSNIAQTLHARCVDSISTLMSSVSIAEAKTAFAQQERVNKLTFLAFIFVPLSFTTSFFSMNAPELKNLPIWTWFITTFVILIASFMFYRGYLQAISNWCSVRLQYVI